MGERSPKTAAASWRGRHISSRDAAFGYPRLTTGRLHFTRIACTAVCCAAFGLTLFFAGCSKDEGPSGPEAPTADELTSQGWSRFESADYDSAAILFGRALETDPTFPDAWNGLGWSFAYLVEPAPADSAFTRANESGLTDAAAWCGLAAVKRDVEGAREEALAAADSALAREPDFVFAHDVSINAADLHLIRGQILVSLGAARLAEAQAEADLLAPGNGLDPDNPATWTVDGETFATYAHALLRLLQNLGETIGAELP